MKERIFFHCFFGSVNFFLLQIGRIGTEYTEADIKLCFIDFYTYLLKLRGVIRVIIRRKSENGFVWATKRFQYRICNLTFHYNKIISLPIRFCYKYDFQLIYPVFQRNSNSSTLIYGLFFRNCLFTSLYCHKNKMENKLSINKT